MTTDDPRTTLLPGDVVTREDGMFFMVSEDGEAVTSWHRIPSSYSTAAVQAHLRGAIDTLPHFFKSYDEASGRSYADPNKVVE